MSLFHLDRTGWRGAYTEDGRYRVDRVSIGAWEAWRTRGHEDGPHLLGTMIPSQGEAQSLCELDAELCRDAS